MTKTIAGASAPSAGPGVIELKLTPAPRYDATIDAGDGLYALVTISFVTSTGERLTEAVPADFVPPLAILRARERAERERAIREHAEKARLKKKKEAL